VGVDRARRIRRRRSGRRPHARGGGPSHSRTSAAICASSPRAWGWTGPRTGGGARAGVVPTRVGVDRHTYTPTSQGGSRLHARGGGPRPTMGRCFRSRSSPRAWGWTGDSLMFEVAGTVVPTRVGVDRPHPRRWARQGCRPHARGVDRACSRP